MTWEIKQGDCLDVMRGMPDASVDAIVTDPPYELANDGKASASRIFLELMFPKHPQVESILTGGDQLSFLVSEILQLCGTGIGDPTPSPTMPVRPVAFDSDAPTRDVDVEDTSECPVPSSQSNRSGDLETESTVHIGDFALKLTDPTAMLEALDSVGAGFTSGAIGVGFRVSSPGAPRFRARECPVVFGPDDVLLRDDALANAIGALAGAAGITVSRFHLGRCAEEDFSAHGALVLCSALLAGGAQLIGASPGARRLPSVLESRLIRVVDHATNRALTFNLLVHPQSITGTGFMGKQWDGSKAAYDVDLWAEALRVAKPGAHLLAFGGTRTFHRLACAIEDAGWEIRDCIMWVYGCLSEDTEILVDGQWEPYHKAIAGRHALCYDVDHDEYQWQPIQDLYVYDYSDTAFRIVSDRTDQIVSRNHRCLVERGGRFVFRLAETLERQETIPILEGVPDLLGHLPVHHAGTGDTEPVLQSPVHTEEPRQSETYRGAQGENGCLCSLREEVLAAGCVDSEGQDSVLLTAMQREGEGQGLGEARTQGKGGMESAVRGQLPGEDERCRESSVEGRRDVLPQARELQADQVHPMPGGVSVNGAERRLRHGTSTDCIDGDRAGAASVGGCASPKPRPAGQSAGESGTVCQQSRPQAVRASRYTVADLARIEPIHYAGKVWCVRVPTGAFVARRNGKVFVTGNSGFPKSLDVSKAIAKRAGGELQARTAIQWMQQERERLGLSRAELEIRIFGRSDGNVRNWEDGISLPKPGLWPQIRTALRHESTPFDAIMERGDEKIGDMTGSYGYQANNDRWEKQRELREPATDIARQWHSWGTALKPAWEPIIVARKPLDGTVAANVLKHGTGAINVDGCRVDANDIDALKKNWDRVQSTSQGITSTGLKAIDLSGRAPSGRWPANLIHDGSDEVVALFPSADGSHPQRPTHSTNAAFGGGRYDNSSCYGDSGSAARFFKCCEQESKCPLCCLPCAEACDILGAWKIALAITAEKNGWTSQATNEFIARVSAMRNQNEKLAQNVKSAGSLCDSCATSIAVALAGIKTSAFSNEELQVILGYIKSYENSILTQSLASFAELWGNTDTIPTTKSLSILFGYVRLATESYTKQGSEAKEEVGSDPEKETAYRFKYSPKASKSDRGEGNNHPTVKPIALMRYLVRLVTPPQGTVLDPFTGSGSTGVAALREGFNFIGIEREQEYVTLAERRIRHDSPLFNM